MIPIREYGHFFATDAAGFLINDTSAEKIPLVYRSPLEELVASYRDQLGTELHSVYLRGSLPRGLFIEGISDIDTFALIHTTNCRWEKADWAEAQLAILRDRFPFLTTVEIMLSSYNRDLQTTYPTLAMQIKTQALCLYGQDIGPHLMPYRVGRSMMQYYPWLVKDLEELKAQEQPSEATVRQSMKTILRTGFELVMERMQQFSPDLYCCYQGFAQYYPDFADLMRQVLIYYLNPSIQKEELKDICAVLGPYLQKEVEERLKEDKNEG